MHQQENAVMATKTSSSVYESCHFRPDFCGSGDLSGSTGHVLRGPLPGSGSLRGHLNGSPSSGELRRNNVPRIFNSGIPRIFNSGIPLFIWNKLLLHQPGISGGQSNTAGISGGLDMELLAQAIQDNE